jgi:Arginine methyltransferase-interacting protein, contains RING Zn-finger
MAISWTRQKNGGQITMKSNKDDHGAMTWENIATEFKEEYCTQRWINKWMKDLEQRKQGPTETVHSYYAAFKKLLKRADRDDDMSEVQKLRYFMRGLLPHLAPIVSMQQPANLQAALRIAQAYEMGQDLNNEIEPPARRTRKSNNDTSNIEEDPMDKLVKKFEKMHLNLAERLEVLSSRVEKQNQRYPQANNRPTRSVNQNGGNQTQMRNQTCFRCGEPGHFARDCLSEKAQPTYNKPKRGINYLQVEVESSEEELEEDLYLGQRGRPPYSKNRKEAKEKVKQSESKKEQELRTRKTYSKPQPMEIEESEPEEPRVSLTKPKKPKMKTQPIGSGSTLTI